MDQPTDDEKTSLEWLIFEQLRQELDLRNVSDVLKSERPDFEMTHAGVRTGVEVTRGCMAEYCQAIDLAKKEQIRHYSISTFQHVPKGEKKRSISSLRAEMIDGDCRETEDGVICWAWRMADKIAAKIERFNQQGFKKLQANWLCIYNFQGDNWGLELDETVNILKGALGPKERLRTTFTAIYILSADHCFLITADHVIGWNSERTIELKS